MEIRNTQNQLNNEVELKKENVERDILEEVKEYNEEQFSKYSNKKFIRPNAMIDFKMVDYDERMNELVFIMPNTKTRLKIQSEMTTYHKEENGDSVKFSFAKLFEILEIEKAIRYSKNNKTFSINDYPISQIIEVGGYLIQFIIQ